MITMISIFSEAKQPDRNNKKKKLNTCSDDVHTIVHVLYNVHNASTQKDLKNIIGGFL